MMETETKTSQPKQANFNRGAYVVFVLAGICFTIFGSDRSQGPLFLSLALIFDPFNIEQPWKERPTYQKVWLITQLAVSLGSLAWLLFGPA